MICSLVTYAQVMNVETFVLQCDSAHQISWDQIIVNNTVVKYKIISRLDSDLNGTNPFYVSTVLLPEYESDIDKNLLQNILSKLLGFHYTNEFRVFKDCGTERLFYQAIKLPKHHQEIADRAFLGIYKMGK